MLGIGLQQLTRHWKRTLRYGFAPRCGGCLEGRMQRKDMRVMAGWLVSGEQRLNRQIGAWDAAVGTREFQQPL